jgi:hypothetical protein
MDKIDQHHPATPGQMAGQKGEKQPLETFCLQPETRIGFPYFNRS